MTESTALELIRIAAQITIATLGTGNTLSQPNTASTTFTACHASILAAFDSTYGNDAKERERASMGSRRQS